MFLQSSYSWNASTSTKEGKCSAHRFHVFFLKTPSVREAVREESEEIPKAVLQTRACIFHLPYCMWVSRSHDTRCVPSEVLLVKYSCGVFLFGRKDMVMNKCLASACCYMSTLCEWTHVFVQRNPTTWIIFKTTDCLSSSQVRHLLRLCVWQ